MCFAAPDQDDVLLIDSEGEGTSGNADDTENKSRKRKLEDKECTSTKRVCTEQMEEEDEIIALD